jgi:hypothetical protein
MKVYGYYHICAINNYLEVVHEQLDALKKSGLIEMTDIINLSICYEPPNFSSLNQSNQIYYKNTMIDIRLINLLDQYLSNENDNVKKYNIRLLGHANLYEKELLNIIRFDSINTKSDFYCWYIHTKGVSNRHQGEDRKHLQNNINSWRLIMEEGVIWNWKQCYSKLDSFDTIGIKYEEHIHDSGGNPMPFKGRFYSGNFWWSKSEYIKTLSIIEIPSNYLSSEMWICSGNGIFYELFSTNLNGYTDNHLPIPNLTIYGLINSNKNSKDDINSNNNAYSITHGRIFNYRQESSLKKILDDYVTNGSTSQDIRNLNIDYARDTMVLKHLKIINDAVSKRNYSNGLEAGRELYQFLLQFFNKEAIDMSKPINDYMKNINCDILEKINSIMDNLPEILHDYFICLYYTGIDNRQSSVNVVILFAILTRANWNFYLGYLRKKRYYDENFKYVGNIIERINQQISDEREYHISVVTLDPLGRRTFSDIDQVIYHGMLQKYPNTTIGYYLNPRRTNIILALFKQNYPLPKNTILINMEQLSDKSSISPDHILKIMQNENIQEIWDYNSQNITYIQNSNIHLDKPIKLFKFGYTPFYRKIDTYDDEQKDIDVLFLGALFPNRIAIRNQLIEKYPMLNIIFKDNTFLDERTDYLRRAKIVLYISSQGYNFPISRISILLTNHSFIISDDSYLLNNTDNNYKHLYSGMIIVPTDKIADNIFYYMNNPDKRKEIAERGFSCYFNSPVTLPV